MAKKIKRFIWNAQESGLFKDLAIIVDTKTGVNYLYAQSGNGGGLTPLLDENGKPIVTKHIVVEE